MEPMLGNLRSEAWCNGPASDKSKRVFRDTDARCPHSGRNGGREKTSSANDLSWGTRWDWNPCPSNQRPLLQTQSTILTVRTSSCCATADFRSTFAKCRFEPFLVCRALCPIRVNDLRRKFRRTEAYGAGTRTREPDSGRSGVGQNLTFRPIPECRLLRS